MSAESRSPHEGLDERLAGASRAERIGLLLSYLGEVVLEIVERPPATPIRADQRIFELGIGSLIVVDLKGRLEERFGVELPVALFFKHSTVGEIAECLLERMPMLAEGAGKEVAVEGVPDPATGRTSRKIEDLSPEEAEAELLAKLDDLDRRITP